MADQETCTDVQLLKRTKISVFVDEALPDILVVTYEFGVKLFKGVLLDSTKKNLPTGVQTLNPAFNVSKPDDDTLYSVNQRFAYTDSNTTKKRNVSISKYKTNKMTVRLRPRQVLCSKCKGICNENSENVTRKRKISDSVQSPPNKRSVNAPVTRSVYKNVTGDNKVNSTKEINEEIDQNTVDSTHSDTNTKKKKLPKKNEETDETKNNNTNSQNNANTEQPLTAANTRTIKISYGPQGEGTVLKIPAKIENLEENSEENITVKDENNKAARKAMKKAKKEAKKKVLTNVSPTYLGGASPRYAMGPSSPRYTVGCASPRHGLGNASPRYLVNAAVATEAALPRKRKHKMKHKKKHKEDRKHRDEEVTSAQDESQKDQLLTQKLSINLKRLNNTYTSCSSSVENDDSGSEDISDQIPNFPPLNTPLVLRLNSQTIPSAPGVNGCKILVGDVVWGKIHGFPWWPGKVLTITNGDNTGPQAHISWYGSPTSSLIQCDELSPYLENFKMRYNKKKRGPYKEAIKQATSDARENAENRLRDPLLGSSPARSFINVVPPALASPREIDVVS